MNLFKYTKKLLKDESGFTGVAVLLGAALGASAGVTLGLSALAIILCAMIKLFIKEPEYVLKAEEIEKMERGVAHDAV